VPSTLQAKAPDRATILLKVFFGVMKPIALVSITIIGGVSCCSLAWLLLERARKNQRARQNQESQPDKNKANDGSGRCDEEGDVVLTPLTDVETRLLSAGINPIATLTWFEGDPVTAAALLRDRVQTIVHHNPWLCGRLVRNQQGQVYLSYSSTIVNIETVVDKLFRFVQQPMDSIHRQTRVANLPRLLTEANMMLQPGCDLIQPLWKVVVLPCAQSPNTCFALVVSLSHAVGDGHTFYQLHNALLLQEYNNTSSTTTMKPRIIPTLQPERIANTLEQQEAAVGADEFRIFRMPGYYFTILRGIFLSKIWAPLPWIGRQYRGESRLFLLDMDQIQSVKDDSIALEEEPSLFVSTNDVLTSWFFENSDCQHGRMNINFRNRLPGHHDNLAGNYEFVLHYRVPQDTFRPALIRKSLSPLKRAVTALEPVRNSELIMSNLSIISNWASFTRESFHWQPMMKGGCQAQLHVPLLDIAGFLPCTVAICIIFQATQDRLGVMVIGSRARISKCIEAPFLADPLL
jgi:hypothetical protein